MQNSILYTREARETVTSHDSDRFQNAASRVHAYRQALKTAKPFSVSVLSYGISFCYSGGILCYHTDDQIRQLDVFGLSRKEKVIDVQALLEHHAIKTVTRASFGDLPTKFELLSCSENVLVFLCTTTSSDKSWLFAIERHQWNATQPRTRILARQHLSCTAKLLVRESDTHLYTGTHSGRTSHEHREWLVQGFDLRTGQALTRKPVQLADFAGSEVGATVCFKIYDNHFYAVTNQNSFEVEEVDWTSYYHVVRFAVDDPAPDVRPRRIWRRQHVEGPLNDTWLDLSLQKDEQTGELLIIECRKEWLSNSSDCIRTYYTTPLNWDETEEISPTRILPANDPMTRTLDDKSRPNYAPARKRTRRHYHREYEDQSGGRRDFILARTRHRSYNAATSSFIDLVSDEVPVPGSWRQQERLRLRIGTRQLKPRITQDPVGHESSHLDEESDQNFTPTKHHMWPPDNASSELYDIICPAGRARPVKVAADERSIVYMTEPLPGKDEGAIVLISFDPAWHPPELTRFTATDGPITDETVTNARTTPDSPPTKKRTCGFSGGEMSSAPRKRRRTETGAEQQQRLVWEEDAAYIGIKKGYWLR